MNLNHGQDTHGTHGTHGRTSQPSTQTETQRHKPRRRVPATYAPRTQRMRAGSPVRYSGLFLPALSAPGHVGPLSGSTLLYSRNRGPGGSPSPASALSVSRSAWPVEGSRAASDRGRHRPHDSPPWIVCAFVPVPTHLPDAYQLHASHGLRPSRFGGAPARRANERTNRTSPSGPSLQFTLGPKRPSAAGHSCNYARHLAFKELLVRWRPLDTLARS